MDPFNVCAMRGTTSAPFFPSGMGTRLPLQPDGKSIAPTAWWVGVRNYQPMSQAYKVVVICKPPIYMIDLPLITQ